MIRIIGIIPLFLLLVSSLSFSKEIDSLTVDFDTLNREQILEVYNSYRDFLTEQEKTVELTDENRQKTVYNLDFSLISLSYAASKRICFFGGWPSLRADWGSCLPPETKQVQSYFNTNEPELALYDEKKCSGYNQFLCSPVMFGPYSSQSSPICVRRKPLRGLSSRCNKKSHSTEGLQKLDDKDYISFLDKFIATKKLVDKEYCPPKKRGKLCKILRKRVKKVAKEIKVPAKYKPTKKIYPKIPPVPVPKKIKQGLTQISRPEEFGKPLADPCPTDSLPKSFAKPQLRHDKRFRDFLNKTLRPHKSMQCQLGATLIDITNPNEVVSAAYNGNKTMASASVSKLITLMGVMDQVSKKKLSLDQSVASAIKAIRRRGDKISSKGKGSGSCKHDFANSKMSVRKLLKRMIKKSSNNASGMSQRLIGGIDNGKYQTAKVAQKYGYGKGSFWLGGGYCNGFTSSLSRKKIRDLRNSDPANREIYSANGSLRGRRSIQEGTSNGVADFYIKLARGQLPKSQEMLDIMRSPPHTLGRFNGVKLPRRRPPVELFRKSGSLSKGGRLINYSDSAMVKIPKCKPDGSPCQFIAVLFGNGSNCKSLRSSGAHSSLIRKWRDEIIRRHSKKKR